MRPALFVLNTDEKEGDGWREADDWKGRLMRRFDERKDQLTTGLGAPAQKVGGRAEEVKSLGTTESGPGEWRGKEREKRDRGRHLMSEAVEMTTNKSNPPRVGSAHSDDA